MLLFGMYFFPWKLICGFVEFVGEWEGEMLLHILSVGSATQTHEEEGEEEGKEGLASVFKLKLKTSVLFYTFYYILKL